MTMTFGMHLGHVGGPMADMRKLWRFADASGFDWFSSADHFQESPYRDGNGPCFEATSTMTAIALATPAKYADGWNAPYIDPRTWKAKNAILDDWCAKEGRDPKTLKRTVNVGFYLGADSKGVQRGEAIFTSHWGENPERKGFFRGTPKDALQGFVETVLPAFGVKRPGA